MSSIGEYVYSFIFKVDPSGARKVQAESDRAEKSVDELGKSFDTAEKEATDLNRAADKTAPAVRHVGDASKEAAAKVKDTGQSAETTGEKLTKLLRTYVAFSTVRRTFMAIVNTATQLDALANAAAAVGSTAAGMARLAYATDLAGVNAAEMDSALRGIRETAGQAAAGIGAGAKAWALIGIRTRDENGNLKDTAQLVDELGERFAQMDEGRAQALGKMLRMTPAVITAMRSGMAGYAREFDTAVKKTGVDLNKAVKAAQSLHSAQSRLLRVSQIVWQGISARFFKPFEQSFDTIRNAMTENAGGLVRFVSTVLMPLAWAVQVVSGAFEAASNIITETAHAFDQLDPRLQTIIKWGVGLIALLKVISILSASAFAPFYLAAGIIGGLLLLIDDFIGAMNGKRSAIDWRPFLKLLKGMKEWGASVVDWFKSLPDKAAEACKKIADKFQSMWQGVIGFFKKLWNDFVEMATGWMPEKLKEQLGIKSQAKEGDAAPAEPTAEPVAALLDTDPARQQIIANAGGTVADTTAQQVAQINEGLATPARKSLDAALKAADAVSNSTPAAITPPAALPADKPAFTAAAPTHERAAANVQPPQPVEVKLTISPAQFVTAAAQTMTATQPRAQVAARAVEAVKAIDAGGRALNSAPALGAPVTNNIDRSRHVDAALTVNNSTTVNISTTESEPAAFGEQVGRAVDESNAAMVRNLQTPLGVVINADSASAE